MSFTTEFTPDAEADLNDLYDYVQSHDSQIRADELVHNIQQLILQLQDLPERGTHPREIYGSNALRYRQLIYSYYRIIYRIIGQRVEILMIADGRRDFTNLVKNRIGDL